MFPTCLFLSSEKHSVRWISSNALIYPRASARPSLIAYWPIGHPEISMLLYYPDFAFNKAIIGVELVN
jgi:hypothetical protein